MKLREFLLTQTYDCELCNICLGETSEHIVLADKSQPYLDKISTELLEKNVKDDYVRIVRAFGMNTPCHFIEV